MTTPALECPHCMEHVPLLHDDGLDPQCYDCWVSALQHGGATNQTAAACLRALQPATGYECEECGQRPTSGHGTLCEVCRRGMIRLRR